MRRKDKAIAISTVAVGIVVLVAVGFAFRNRILELWYLHRVKTEEDWRVLAERLGDLESVDAIIYFFGEMARLEPETIHCLS
jgi:hypothetical protein